MLGLSTRTTMALASLRRRAAAWRERAAALEGECYALALALRDERTPRSAKLVIGLTVAYAASPIDPIPDFVPVVGYLDELVVLPVGVALARRRVPEAVMVDCRDRAAEDFDVGRARWLVAGVVVCLWVGAGVLAVRAVL